jgi:uncharacterized protein with HEPN domain
MSRDKLLYLEDVIDGLKAIQSYTDGLTQESFVKDPKTMDACVRRFQIVGDAVKKFPSAWFESEPGIPWARITGMRNMLVHQYFRIDDVALWRASQEDLLPLLEACECIQQRVGQDR